jgi:hypothetical protein
MVHSTVVHARAFMDAVDTSVGVEATELYPEVKFVTVEEYLDALVLC